MCMICRVPDCLAGERCGAEAREIDARFCPVCEAAAERCTCGDAQAHEVTRSDWGTLNAFRGITITMATLWIRVWDDERGWVWFDIVSGAGEMSEFTSELEPAESYRFDFTVSIFGRPTKVKLDLRT